MRESLARGRAAAGRPGIGPETIRNLDLVHVRGVGNKFHIDIVSRTEAAGRNLHVNLIQPG